MRALNKTAQGRPFPAAGPIAMAECETLIPEIHTERVPECFSPAVNQTRQDEPETDHQDDPEHGTDQERQGTDLLQCIQADRQNSEYIHQDQHDPDLRPADEMIAQCLYHLSFIVTELNGHVQFF